MLAQWGVYLHQFLLICSDLETELSQFYEQVAGNAVWSKDEATAWRRMADQEARNAQVINTVASLQWLLDREGPFLAELPARIEQFQVKLEEAIMLTPSARDADQLQRRLDPVDANELHEISIEALRLCAPLVERLGRLLDAPQGVLGISGQ